MAAVSLLHDLVAAMAVLGGASQIFLGGFARHSEPIADLLHGVTANPLEDQGSGHPGWQLTQGLLERFNALGTFGTMGWIFALRGLQLRQGLRDIDRNRLARTAQRVLVNNVARDSEQIGLGISNGLVPLYPQQAQKDLLGKVRHIVHIAQAHGQKSAQAPAVLGGDAGKKALSF